MLTLMEYIVDQLFELNRLHAGDPDTEFESTQDKSNPSIYLPSSSRHKNCHYTYPLFSFDLKAS